MLNPRPSGIEDTVPEGKSARPFYGIDPCIMDDNGNEITDQYGHGHLCIKQVGINCCPFQFNQFYSAMARNGSNYS